MYWSIEGERIDKGSGCFPYFCKISELIYSQYFTECIFLLLLHASFREYN